jgi:hypothetical protein
LVVFKSFGGLKGKHHSICLFSVCFLTAVKFLERLELLNQGLVLVFEYGYSILQTFDVFLLFPATFSSRFSVL